MSVTIHIGDALGELRKMDSDSVDCIVTSPPYWGLRDYGVDGQLGLEPTLAEHIAALVELFEECRRVLKPHGTFWLNYGDCYATTPNGRSAADTKTAGTDDRTFRDKPFSTVGPVFGAMPGDPTKAANGSGRFGGGNAPAGGYLKPKDLCMIPNRLAIALQDAGWWVRSEIIWGKPNPMPDSSGNYRPSTAHEKIFLLAKSADAPVYVARDTGEVRFDPDLSERCALITDGSRDGVRWRKIGHFYDAAAVRSSAVSGSTHDVMGWASNGETKTAISHNRGARAKKDKRRGHARPHDGFNCRWDQMTKAEQGANGRLLRNYEPDADQFVGHVHPEVWDIATAAYSDAHFATFPPALVIPCIMGGCPKISDNGKPGVVLDPFGGSGTTGLIAQALQRDCILIELNPEYAAMAKKRLRQGKMSGRKGAVPVPAKGQGTLFAEEAA